MYILAVTGGLGAGKSTAAEVFAERGAIVIDLDDVAKTLLDESSAVRDRVLAAFGEQILGPDGRLDRSALASLAFASAESAARLDAIVHPAVLAAVAGALDTLALQGDQPPIVVLVIPLLAESPLFLEPVDAVLAISATEEDRLDRAVARGMARDDAERRIACQAGDGERRDIADYVIENDGDLETFRHDLISFWDTEIAHRLG
ncbi:MAG: dephospho-CoA kinase [Coriobacteriia bacterium]|nr:dephospho-CoA kinase [Coriobacteriia bacterium]